MTPQIHPVPSLNRGTQVGGFTPPWETEEPSTLNPSVTSAEPPYIPSASAIANSSHPPNWGFLSSPSSNQETMANFTYDPTPFLPFGAHMEDGWQRLARIRVTLGGELERHYSTPSFPSTHCRTRSMLAPCSTMSSISLRRIFRSESSHFLSPLGLGLVEFSSSVMRQSMLDISPIEYNATYVLHVVKHDEAGNLRAVEYSRESWIMFLVFPLDY